MRRLATLVATISLLVAPTASAVTIFNAVIDGIQEVPPNGSAASGTASLTLNDTQDRLTISIQLTGIDLDGNQTGDPGDDLTIAHIHRAAFGANGPVVFGFVGPNSDLNGDLVIDALAGTIVSAWDANEGAGTTLAAELANLFAGGLYINIHTSDFPGGEIRGQIVPEPATALLVASGLVGMALRTRSQRER